MDLLRAALVIQLDYVALGGGKRDALFPLGIGELQNMPAAGFEQADIILAILVGLRRYVFAIPQGANDIGAVDIPVLKATSTSSSTSGRQNAPRSFPAIQDAMRAQLDSGIPISGIFTFTNPGPGLSAWFVESLLMTIPTITPKIRPSFMILSIKLLIPGPSLIGQSSSP